MIYHGDSGFADLPSTVAATVAAIRPHRDRFDSIVVTGMSGVVVGVPVSLALGIPLTIVRKEKDICHSPGKFINLEGLGHRYLVIDDFKSTGRTIDRIRQVVGDLGGYESPHKYAGAYYYGDRAWPCKPVGFKWAVGRPAKARS